MAFVVGAEKDERLATLLAYAHMTEACWPGLHPTMVRRKPAWVELGAKHLGDELSSLMDEADGSPMGLRVFWKLVPNFTFRGGNTLFAKDAGHKSMQTLMGLTDFSKEVPWNRQAPLYRKDDEDVVATQRDKLDIVQRQDQASDTIYLHAAKVPMLSGSKTVGLMGAYQLIDAAAAARIISRKR